MKSTGHSDSACPSRRLAIAGAIIGVLLLHSSPEPRSSAGQIRTEPSKTPESGAIRISGAGFTQSFETNAVGLDYKSTRLEFSLIDIRLGNRPLVDGVARPEIDRGDVVYRRGPVVERYTPRGPRVDQSFVLDASLEEFRHEGDLCVRVSLASPSRPLLRHQSATDRLEFRDSAGRLAMVYGAATAIDAEGRRRKLDYALEGDVLVMTLKRDFLAGAKFPLVVDPTIGLSTTLLEFNSPEGGPNPLPQEVLLTNTSTGKLTFDVEPSEPWLAARKASNGPVNAGGDVEIDVEVDVTGLAPGTYIGTVTVTSDDADNSPQVIDVTLIISSTIVPDPPIIEVVPGTLSAEASEGGPNPLPRKLRIRNGGGAILNWSASVVGGGIGLSVNPSSGSLEPGSLQFVNVSFDVVGAALVAGSYSDTIRFEDAAASNSPRDVPVALEVQAPPAIEATPARLDFSAPLGGPSPFPQVLSIQNTGGSLLVWSAAVVGISPWLSLGTTAGTLSPGQSQEIPVIVFVTGLTEVGTYKAEIEILGVGAVKETVAVQLVLDPAPLIQVSPSFSIFTSPVGGTPAPQIVTISNVGGGTLNWSLDDDAPWLSGAPSSGSLAGGASEEVTVSVDTAGLAAGPYVGRVVVTDLGNPGHQAGITGVMILSALPLIEINPEQLTFVAPEGGPNPAGAFVTIRNGGGGTLNWSATAVGAPAWLVLSPASGALNGGSSEILTVTADATGAALAPGSYTAEVLVSDAGSVNSPQTLAVGVTVSALPFITRSPKALLFKAPEGGTSPPSQSVQITNSGAGNLAWTISVDPAVAIAWLTVSSFSGNLAAGESESIDVTVDPAGLSPGVRVVILRISAGGASNSPSLVAVGFNVLPGPAPPVVEEASSAGYCGLLGVEFLIPLGFLALWRRRRSSRRAVPLVALLVFAGAAPASFAQEERADKWLDFDACEIAPHVGLVNFSPDFEGSAEVSGGVSFRVPSPFVSTLIGEEARAVGIWLDATFTQLERDLTTPEDTQSSPFFFSFGVDIECLGGDGFTFALQGGGQYGMFNLDGVDDGWAGYLGVRGSLKLTDSLRLGLIPKAAFGYGGDQVYFVDLALEIRL